MATWRNLAAKIKSSALVDMYIQKYIEPNKGRDLLYRFTYVCNPEKSHRTSYVEILAPKYASKVPLCEAEENWVLQYKSHNGLKELEEVGKKITQLANMVCKSHLTSGIWLSTAVRAAGFREGEANRPQVLAGGTPLL